MLIGIYMRGIRPGRMLEGSLIGIALLIVCVLGGGWVDHNEIAARLVRLERMNPSPGS